MNEPKFFYYTTLSNVAQRTLSDIRDGNTYTVRKLADGNCWMVENLKYDLRGLYNEGKRGVGSRNDGSTFEMTDANLASGVSYYTTTTNAYDAVLSPNTNSISNITRYSYSGNTTGTEYYYTWTAATAGQGSTADATEGTTINGSICPAGWRLPTNYTDTANQNISWSALTNVYLGVTTNTSTGYQILEQHPTDFYRVGLLVGSGIHADDTFGYYWSGTVSSASHSYDFDIATSRVWPQQTLYKYYGFSLRCLANR